MLGAIDGDDKTVRVRCRSRMPSQGEQARAVRAAAGRSAGARTSEARERGMDLIGIYHSHPDCDAYFSKTDLKNSCPWYSFVVLSIKGGKFDHANSFLPNPDQTDAEKEELYMAKVLIPTPLRQFAGKKDTVELTGATVGEVLTALTTQFPRSAQAAVQRRREAAKLRERVPQRRRHPLPEKGRDSGEGRRYAVHRAQHRRRHVCRLKLLSLRRHCQRKRSCAIAGT